MDIHFSAKRKHKIEFTVSSPHEWYMGNNLNPFKSKRVTQTIAEILVQNVNGTINAYQY